MSPGGRTGLVAAGALVLSALAAAAAAAGSSADPDFPTIPARPAAEGEASDQGADSTGQSASPQSPGGEEDESGAASAQDCASFKHLVSHVDVLLGRQVSVTPAFPSKPEGEQAVAQDLDILNNVLPFLVAAEEGVQDPEQRAKIISYKNDLGQLSLVIAERSKQDLAAPASYDWSERLARANSRAEADYSRIKTSCFI